MDMWSVRGHSTVEIMANIYWTGSSKYMENYETEKLYELSTIKFKRNAITRRKWFCLHNGIDSS